MNLYIELLRKLFHTRVMALSRRLTQEGVPTWELHSPKCCLKLKNKKKPLGAKSGLIEDGQWFTIQIW